MAAAKDLGLRGDDAANVRKRIGNVAQRALAKLSEELELYKPKATKRARGRGQTTQIEDAIANRVPLDWVERFAKIADQLRRDYVIDESAEPAEKQEPADPLHGLKVV